MKHAQEWRRRPADIDMGDRSAEALAGRWRCSSRRIGARGRSRCRQLTLDGAQRIFPSSRAPPPSARETWSSGAATAACIIRWAADTASCPAGPHWSTSRRRAPGWGVMPPSARPPRDARAAGETPTGGGSTRFTVTACREIRPLTAVEAAGSRPLRHGRRRERGRCSRPPSTRCAPTGADRRHGAGVLADKLLPRNDSSWPRLPHQGRRAGPPRRHVGRSARLLCSFSGRRPLQKPRAGRLRHGQRDLNKVTASSLTRPGILEVVGWGPWAGGMVTPGSPPTSRPAAYRFAGGRGARR